MARTPAVQHRRAWWATAATLVILGCLSSVIGARIVAKNDALASRHLFEASSLDVVSRLKLDIVHEHDLVTSIGAYFVNFPDASQTDFEHWMSALDALHRYPEVDGVAEIVMVTRPQLAGFEARFAHDAAGSLTNGTLQVIPSGTRPYYCLANVEVTRRGDAAEPTGLDFCDTPLGPLFLKARETGDGALLPFGDGSREVFVLGTPIYSTGAVPTSERSREAHFIGWTGTELAPHVLLNSALKDHPTMAVTFSYHSGSTTQTFTDGSAPKGARSHTSNFHNGWSATTFGVVDADSIVANPNALALLVSGIALSLLLSLLILILGTSRVRALILVKERTDELEHLSLHDSLTGLPNRALILDRIEQVIARARRDNTDVALLFFDLDNFKDINDTLGHHAGDELLVEVGHRLARTLRGGDTIGRLGGDEFVILAEGASLAPGAEALAERMLEVMKSPFVIPSSAVPLNVSASIGIAEGTRSAAEDLLRDADIAMYRAKSVGKQRAVMFLPSMQEDVIDKHMLAIDLHEALDAGEFFLLYQPIVELETGAVTGVEALLRWQHRERGVMEPEQFIPALESSGLIVPVGQWILQEACRQGALWSNSGLDLTVSVNISAKQLERDQFVDDVLWSLNDSTFDPSMLILELTETTLMTDVTSTVDRLTKLKRLGVRLAIDDFGTGYSSLAYLRQFPIDIIKIDRSFVSGLFDTAEAAALVHALVELGRALGLGIIAEGVETDEQRRRLIAEHADAAQGYLFARPLDTRGVEEMLADQNRRTETSMSVEN